MSSDKIEAPVSNHVINTRLALLPAQAERRESYSLLAESEQAGASPIRGISRLKTKEGGY